MGMVTAKKTYFLNADKSAVVKEDDPKAAFLLVREGGEIDEAELAKYGLKGKRENEVEAVDEVKGADKAKDAAPKDAVKAPAKSK